MRVIDRPKSDALLPEKEAARKIPEKNSIKVVKPTLIFFVQALILFGVIVVASGFGSAPISLAHIAAILVHLLYFIPVPHIWTHIEEVIILQIRLPRVLGAGLVGASLAMSGVLFQGLFRNPLADPYIIGASSGAGLGATIGFVFPVGISFLGFGSVAILAFFGALSCVFIAYFLARVGGRVPVVNLLLAGVVVTAIATALQTFALTMGDRLQLHILFLFTWLAGGIQVASWEQLGFVAVLVLFGTLIAFALSHSVDVLALGDDQATLLGINVERQKILMIIAASLLTASAVAISGLIGFVGLVVPHTMRMILGPRSRILFPASALAGAIFLILADMLARIVLAPAVMPVGVVTALIGGPFFLYLLRVNGDTHRW